MDTGLEGDKNKAYVEEKREECCEVLLDIADNFLALIDTNLRYIYVNKNFANWLSLPKSDFQRKPLSETFSNVVYNAILPKIKAVFQGEHVQFTLNDGITSKSVELTPYRNTASDITGCIWSARNITDSGLHLEHHQTRSENILWDEGLNAMALLTPEATIIQTNDNWGRNFWESGSRV